MQILERFGFPPSAVVARLGLARRALLVAAAIALAGTAVVGFARLDGNDEHEASRQ